MLATVRTPADRLLKRPPEVAWRLGDVLLVAGRAVEDEQHMEAGRTGFEKLLDKHLLAFAHHGAEFCAGSGGDLLRALELAQINLKNRPTLRAFKQNSRHCDRSRPDDVAAAVLAKATRAWGQTPLFQQLQFGCLEEGAIT